MTCSAIQLVDTIRDSSPTQYGSKTFTVNEGTSVKVSITPENGYRIKSVIEDGIDVTANVNNNQYTTNKVTSNKTLNVTFEEIPVVTYALSVTASGSGTVNYLNHEDLRSALDYDIAQEKQFSYKNLSQDDIIAHIAQFISGIWQIHAFGEGNTRTTAVFTIQYLRSIGYEVHNELFASYSWYFRNALVRANYKNAVQGVDYSPIYLERFFRNLLLGEQWELKSRYLVINPPAEYAEQPKMDVGNVTENVTEKVTNVTENVIEKLTDRQRQIVKMVAQYPFTTTTLMAQTLNVSLMTIRRDIEKMAHIIRHVGPDKGGHWEIIKE